jgi:hypothetical protein
LKHPFEPRPTRLNSIHLGDLFYLQGLQGVCLRGAQQQALTDATLAHLQGTQALDLSGADCSAVSEAGLLQLQGLPLLLCNVRTNLLLRPIELQARPAPHKLEVANQALVALLGFRPCDEGPLL